ncbi:MAG: hypothetical protein ACNA8W_11430, partial [Bradymonadaceae bacterium]
MQHDLEEDLAEFRKDGVLLVAFHGSRQSTYRLVVWCYVFGGLCHLWLGDADEPGWLLANLLFLTGLILLAWRGAALGWVLACTGKLIPLLFLRDHLTQSLLLATIAFAGAAFMAHEGYRSLRRPPEKRPAPYGDSTSAELGFLKVVRGLTIATYALAAVHKVNRDFFERTVGCASYGVDKLVAYWNVAPALVPEALFLASPYLIIVTEAAIAVLYLAGLRRICWPLVVAFHIPLTLTMAPAFAFVMLAGHAAFVLPRDIDDVRGVLRRYGLIIAPVALVATAASLWAHGKWPEWTMIPREYLLWALLLTTLLLLARGIDWRRHRVHKSSAQQRAATLIVALFLIHGLSPYLGVRFQHTAAMVSGLRIDEGCWNSLIFPEALRLSDGYIRIETAYFREPGAAESLETTLLEQLWSPPQLRQMRRNWCRY